MNIETFSEADLPVLNRLQPADWGMMYPFYAYYLSHENCTPLKLTQFEETLAIGAVIRHEDSAWLAHIVVDEQYRNKGLGKQITKALIDLIDPVKYTSIYLMATPLGLPVYKSLGFEVESLQSFYRRDTLAWLPDNLLSQSIKPVQLHEYEQILELDKQISGEKRAYRLLDGIETAFVTHRHGRVSGFYLPNVLEGPVLANNPEDGLDLLKYRLSQKNEAVVPDDNVLANRFLAQSGMTKYRFASRMRLGKHRPYQADQVFNRYSGQIG